jgi:hypothetical protein
MFSKGGAVFDARCGELEVYCVYLVSSFVIPEIRYPDWLIFFVLYAPWLMFNILNQDRKIKEIVLKAMGQAISKSVAVTEIIKVILQFCFSHIYMLHCTEPYLTAFLKTEKNPWIVPGYQHQFCQHN